MSFSFFDKIIDIVYNSFYNLSAKTKTKGVITMSVTNYINDILKSLELSENNGGFIPIPYVKENSCFRYEKKKDGTIIKYVHLVSTNSATECPECACVHNIKSKGLRKIYLHHATNGHTKTILEISYRRYQCHNCQHSFKDTIPFRFFETKMTYTLAQSTIRALQENTALAVIARTYGISKSTMYRIFYDHIYLYHRCFQLSSVISIDEFRGTSDEGIYAFNIVNPITGKVLDILGDRKAVTLKKYFGGFSHEERAKVKIIIMDLSGPFKSIMTALFPKAVIIADKFHYVRLVGDNLTQARIQFCKKIHKDHETLSKLIKRNLHLFDRYYKELGNKKENYIPYFKKYLTNKQLVEAILELEICEEFKENYDIYQNFLKILHEPSNDYKKALNAWLDYIFETNNTYYEITAKNFRKNWFLPILRSLTYKATYHRNGTSYTTSFNNGCIESLNNKFKLVKRNAYGYRYFQNLRKRIFLHLGYSFQFIEKQKRQVIT